MDRFLIFFIASVFSIQTFAAVRSLATVNLEIEKNQMELDSFQSKLKKIRNEILALRNNVAGETDKFSKIISIKNNLKLEVENRKTELSKEEERLESELKVVRNIFAGMLLLDETEEEIDYSFITVDQLKNKEKLLKSKKEKIQKLSIEIQEMEKQIGEYDFIETDLISNIERIHQDEKNLLKMQNDLSDNLNDFQQKIKSLNSVKIKIKEERKLAEEKLRLKIKKEKEEEERLQEINQVSKNIVEELNNSEDFILPLDSYSSVKKDKMGGLSFYINSDKNIVSPADGKIAYTGKLSTYGNVIVIKHQNDFQSVILGDVISNVFKGNLIKKGQIVGKIVENNGDMKKVYFELRNKNKKVAYDQIFKSIKL